MTTPILPWPPLIRGTLISRYKRFLADIRLADGSVVTAHCPNSGRMTACATPGAPVWISAADNPRRKLQYTWELIRMPTSLVGVNTQVPNRLVAETIAAGGISGLTGYPTVEREVRVGNGSRLDIRLSGRTPPCYVEVKNCTLVEGGLARFPDAATARGRKHLSELARLKADGCRCVIFFLIQRMDAAAFAPADAIDPEYGRLLRRVVADAGVEIMVWDVAIDLSGIRIRKPIPCSPDLTFPRVSATQPR